MTHKTPVSSIVVTEIEAAQMLRLSVRTLQRLRLQGDGPPFCLLTPSGRRITYPVSELRAWTESRVVASTSDATVGKAGRASGRRAA